ncbi:flagellar brake protein [Caballeronia sp. LjRoot34]|jgi:c-di-GMP-binding flagellar brake protein YcgR|uniref:flagellar brake protein n=1 Tax=Caballeronia sp. LjRoot34 TaxID=3342325 RepID=UPI003ECE8132
MIPESDSWNDGSISNPLEIGGLLRSLAHRLDNLTADYGEQHTITRILDVDIAARTFIFDSNADQIKFEVTLSGVRWIFHAAPRGIRMEFSVDGVQPVSFEGKAAFKGRFPSVLLCRQRREYFRVRTPVLDPYLCSGSLANGERFRAEIVDLSLSGVALRMIDDHLGNLDTGSIVRDAELHFSGQSPISLDLQFVSYRDLDGIARSPRFILGFKFLSLPGHTENVLQRLIARLELERRLMP